MGTREPVAGPRVSWRADKRVNLGNLCLAAAGVDAQAARSW
ncbi:hypothetical protein OH687_12995 [Burkholderia anthina]|nr:hypothetical protein OH687_12995 [Burkholderia anthina]